MIVSYLVSILGVGAHFAVGARLSYEAVSRQRLCIKGHDGSCDAKAAIDKTPPDPSVLFDHRHTMKLVALLFLSAALAVGHILPRPMRNLVARAGQQLTNPENEPDYEDPTTGSKTPKSRVLSGVGPEEADNRWFDWDESCSDADQRTKILATFRYIIQLSGSTSNHLDELQKGLPNPVGTKSFNKDNKKYIFSNDPAYAQMFLGEDNRIQYVKETFDLLTTNAQKTPDARGGNKPGALRFICNADNKVMNGDESQPYCGYVPSNPTPSLSPFAAIVT